MKKLILFSLLIMSTHETYSMVIFTAANVNINAAAASIANQERQRNQSNQTPEQQTAEREAALSYLAHCNAQKAEAQKRKAIRHEFETRAGNLPSAQKENIEALSKLYKEIDPLATDQFVAVEIDNYLKPCGCCYPGPSKVCVIL